MLQARRIEGTSSFPCFFSSQKKTKQITTKTDSSSGAKCCFITLLVSTILTGLVMSGLGSTSFFFYYHGVILIGSIGNIGSIISVISGGSLTFVSLMAGMLLLAVCCCKSPEKKKNAISNQSAVQRPSTIPVQPKPATKLPLKKVDSQPSKKPLVTGKPDPVKKAQSQPPPKKSQPKPPEKKKAEKPKKESLSDYVASKYNSPDSSQKSWKLKYEPTHVLEDASKDKPTSPDEDLIEESVVDVETGPPEAALDKEKDVFEKNDVKLEEVAVGTTSIAKTTLTTAGKAISKGARSVWSWVRGQSNTDNTSDIVGIEEGVKKEAVPEKEKPPEDV